MLGSASGGLGRLAAIVWGWGWRWLAGLALAHASLVRSDPAGQYAPGAVAGQTVTAWYDEPSSPTTRFLSVYDRAGMRVDRLDAAYDAWPEPSMTPDACPTCRPAATLWSGG